MAASWHRSLTSDLSPDRLDVPYDPEPPDGDRLLQMARPVLTRLAEDLSSVSMSVVLADPSGRILDRSVADAKLREQLDSVMLAPGFRYGEDDVGTNALGISLLKNEPVIITGDEHFVDALTAMVCAAAPIVDPVTETVLGAVDLTGPTGASEPLMLALARQAARSIVERVLDHKATVRDGALLHSFLRERRKARDPWWRSTNTSSSPTRRPRASSRKAIGNTCGSGPVKCSPAAARSQATCRSAPHISWPTVNGCTRAVSLSVR